MCNEKVNEQTVLFYKCRCVCICNSSLPICKSVVLIGRANCLLTRLVYLNIESDIILSIFNFVIQMSRKNLKNSLNRLNQTTGKSKDLSSLSKAM